MVNKQMPGQSKDSVSALPRKDRRAYFDTGHKNLTSTSLTYLIATLRGGQAVLIKALVCNTGSIYVGKQDVTSSNGFELAPGESIKIEYSPDKVVEEYIELYAICATANDDVCFIIVP